MTCWAYLPSNNGPAARFVIRNPVRVPDLVGVRDLATTWDGADTCAALADGTLRCFRPDENPDKPVSSWSRPAPALGQVEQLVAGHEHFCARHTGGQVSCWGPSELGQLGDGSGGGRPTLLRVR